MLRRAWPLALAAAVLCGCQENDPEKINNELTGQAPDPNAPPTGGGAPGSSGMPSGYPGAPSSGGYPGMTKGGMPGGMTKGGGPGMGKRGGALGGEAGKPGDEAAPGAEAPKPETETAPPVGEPIPPAGEGETAPAPAETPKPEAGEAAPGKAAELGEEERANIAKLPPADQALALAQGVCLISGEPLGSMGVPIRVEHKGKVGYLCCKGCTADFNAQADELLSKMQEPKSD
jgi:hypothetical protein